MGPLSVSIFFMNIMNSSIAGVIHSLYGCSICSRWGQRLGQKKAESENKNLCKTKNSKFYDFEVFCILKTTRWASGSKKATADEEK